LRSHVTVGVDAEAGADVHSLTPLILRKTRHDASPPREPLDPSPERVPSALAEELIVAGAVRKSSQT
jgi:hypothetical protein